MLIWNGWGFMVVVLGVVGITLGNVISDTLVGYGYPYGPSHSIGIMAGAVIGAGAIHLFANWREGRPSRFFIEEATGKRIELRSDAGTFFFVPARAWAWILVAVAAAVAFTVYGDAGPSSSDY